MTKTTVSTPSRCAECSIDGLETSFSRASETRLDLTSEMVSTATCLRRFLTLVLDPDVLETGFATFVF